MGGYCRPTNGPPKAAHILVSSTLNMSPYVAQRQQIAGAPNAAAVPDVGTFARVPWSLQSTMVSGTECVDAHVKNVSFSKPIRKEIQKQSIVIWIGQQSCPKAMLTLPLSVSWCRLKRPVSFRHLAEHTILFCPIGTIIKNLGLQGRGKKLWPMTQILPNSSLCTALWEDSYIYIYFFFFGLYYLWMLSCDDDRVEELWLRLYDPQA